MKKILVFLLMITILSMTSGVFAAYQDVPSGASYSDAVARVTSLGVMDDRGNGSFKPNDPVTKEEFSKIIVIAAGLGDTAVSLAGSTEFSDVEASNAYSGYINGAISKGYITGGVDGKFHPKDPVTYAQVCTAMVKVLGYAAQDVPGVWPKNYIEKAKALGITSGVTLASSSTVTRSVMAVMLDNLMDTNIKKVNAADADKTLAEASQLTTDTMYTIYSTPESVKGSLPSNLILGDINLNGNPSIVRNSVDNSTNPAIVKTGELIGINDIKDKDIVYEVWDKAKSNRYILVIDSKISGQITGIMPNKFTPNKIQVEGVDYQLGKYFEASRLNTSSGSFNIGDNVSVLLGYDGNVADIVSNEGYNNSNYAFVLNYSSMVSSGNDNYNQRQYSVKMLLADGTTKTFDTAANPANFKGKLVKFEKDSNGSISLEEVQYSPLSEVSINKDNRQLFFNSNNYNYGIANNVKVFNLIANNSDTDANVKLMSWSDVPSGVIQGGVVKYIGIGGAFEDVNLIVFSDVNYESYDMGVITATNSNSSTRTSTYIYTISINGKDYTYSSPGKLVDANVGTAVRVTLSNNGIQNIHDIINPDMKSTYVQAIDASRIRINGITCGFMSNRKLFLEDSSGNFKEVEQSAINTNKLYSDISVYLDRAVTSGGKVQLIVIKEL